MPAPKPEVDEVHSVHRHADSVRNVHGDPTDRYMLNPTVNGEGRSILFGQMPEKLIGGASYLKTPFLIAYIEKHCKSVDRPNASVGCVPPRMNGTLEFDELTRMFHFVRGCKIGGCIITKNPGHDLTANAHPSEKAAVRQSSGSVI